MATSEVVDSEIKMTKKTDNGKKVQDMLTTPETVFNLVLCVIAWLVLFTMYHNYIEIGSPFRLVSFFYRKYVNEELYIVASIGVVVTLSIHCTLTLLIEKALLKRTVSEEAALTGYILIMISSLASPIVWFTYVPIPGGNRSILITCSCYAFMKTISYYQVNKQHRIAYFKSHHTQISELQEPTKRKLVKYPDNLNLKDALYFTFVPTYCYDMNIKKDDHFKWMDLIVQVGHFLLGAEAMLNILDHLITPQLADFYEDPGFLQFYGFKHFLHCTAKASLLAWPLVALTLLCCYIVLYKTLAVMAVVLRYPERSFCGEWWNVTETKDYWAKWNLPVHKWLIKHVYRPCREAGIPTLMSALITFVFSGVLHDYAIMAVMEVNTYFVVTLVMIYSVAGIPYTRAVKRIFGPRISNVHILQMWYLSAVGAILFQYKKKM